MLHATCCIYLITIITILTYKFNAIITLSPPLLWVAVIVKANNGSGNSSINAHLCNGWKKSQTKVQKNSEVQKNSARFDLPSCGLCINCINALRKAYNALSTQLSYNIIVKPYKEISWWKDMPSSMLHNKHKEITRKLIQNLVKELRPKFLMAVITSKIKAWILVILEISKRDWILE